MLETHRIDNGNCDIMVHISTCGSMFYWLSQISCKKGKCLCLVLLTLVNVYHPSIFYTIWCHWVTDILVSHERCMINAYVIYFICLQILTQEDWNEVLYNGMSKTSAWAALYFIALMTFGNYVLFNLLVAILVEGFSSEVGKITRPWAPSQYKDHLFLGLGTPMLKIRWSWPSYL